MAVNTKTIKRRIKSIGNTKKITKAMEMISAVKMRRAVANVLATRSYANLAWEMLAEIATALAAANAGQAGPRLTAVAEKTSVAHHPLLDKREVKKVGVILITSNRGLAGGFNSRLLQEVHRYIQTVILNGAERREKSLSQSPNGQRSLTSVRDDNERTGVEVEIILNGKRGRSIYQRFGHTVAAEFEKMDLTTKIDEILPMAQMAAADYIAGKYDRIVVAYTDYVSAIWQEPRLKQILPIEQATETPPSVPPLQGEGITKRSSPYKGEDKGGGFDSIHDAVKLSSKGELVGYGFIFEPDPKQVLEILLPRLIEMQIYQAILESDASEHSARMMAMRSASDAAEEMIKELNYSFNKARQAAITQEISEIVGGAAALG